MKLLNYPFHNCKPCIGPQKEHIYAICCRPEVDANVISSRNVKTIEGYVVVTLKLLLALKFPRYSQKNHFVTAAEAAPVDIDDRIKRKCFRAFLKKSI